MNKQNKPITKFVKSDELSMGIAHNLKQLDLQGDVELRLGLSYNLNSIIPELAELLKKDREKAIIFFNKRLKGLEQYVQKKYGVQPYVDETVEDFLKNRKMHEAMTDEHIINAAKKRLEKICELEAKQLMKNTSPIKSFTWKKSPELLPKLYKALILKKYIDPKTSLENFIKIFSNVEISEKEKVEWIVIARNKLDYNKKAISDLIYLLDESDLINNVKKEYIKNKLGHCFKTPATSQLIFSDSNLVIPVKGKFSAKHSDLKQIIEGLK